MSSVSECPDELTLRQYADGGLSGHGSRVVRQHLIKCRTCSLAVSALQAKAAPTAALPVQPVGGVGGQGPFSGVSKREHSTVSPSESSSSAHPTPSPATAATQVSKTVESPGASEGFDFLAPAQQADELGRLGPYRILQVLGEGGMGMVFKAQDVALERLVALKVMKPDKSIGATMRQRFLQEAKVAASLQHDHIVTVYQVGEDRGVPFMAMQFLLGEPLDRRLQREGRLPMIDVVRIGRQTAEGLAAAHDHDLIHRDIKPANIWLENRDRDSGVKSPVNRDAKSSERSADFRVKILDFGLARIIGDNAQHLTRTGMVVGTPGYMAPEQGRGKGVDHRCDLFSLGCVLYHMCTGREPFHGDDVMAVLMALATEEPPPIKQLNPDVPQALVELIARMMAKDPRGRPDSVKEVIGVLGTFEKTLTKFARRASPSAAEEDEAEAPTEIAAFSPGADPPSTQPSPEATQPLPTPAEDYLGPCPKCGAPRTSTAFRGWCSSCGYYPDIEKYDEALSSKKKGVPEWCWVLLGGVIIIAIVSAFGHFNSLPHSKVRAWWGVIQLGIGFFLLLAANLWNYLLVLPTSTRTRFSIFSFFFPLQLWITSFGLLPITRKPICTGGWSLTTMLCAVLIVGGQLDWIRLMFLSQPKEKPRIRVVTAGSGNEEKSVEDNVVDFTDTVSVSQSNEELDTKDKKKEDELDIEKIKPEAELFSDRFTIIGYVPGGKKSTFSLLLAGQSDGQYYYAGRVSCEQEKDAALRRLKPLKQRANAPMTTAVIEDAIWYEPKESCEVEYGSIGSTGVLKDPQFKGW